METYHWAEQDVILKPPASPGRAAAVMQLAAGNITYAAGAALALCWPTQPKEKALPASCRLEVCQYSPGLLAERLYEEMASRGVSAPQVLRVGSVCLAMMAEQMGGLSAQEVRDEVDFSEPGREG